MVLAALVLFGAVCAAGSISGSGGSEEASGAATCTASSPASGAAAHASLSGTSAEAVCGIGSDTGGAFLGTPGPGRAGARLECGVPDTLTTAPAIPGEAKPPGRRWRRTARG